MENISSRQAAEKLLGQCLRGEAWDRGLVDALVREGGDALFRVVAEGLADRFEPRLCRLYDEIFAYVLGVDVPRRAVPREVREFGRVFVLSRVTLGADIAVTSVVLDAAKRRFPRARIYLAGPRKNWELFAGDTRIGHAEVPYRRGGIADRLAHVAELRAALDGADALVIDPDSRLTQLGLLPVSRPENTLFFESRSYGGEGDEPLTQLAARWCRETLGVEGAPYFAVPERAIERPAIAISLGTGENPSKRVEDPFEHEMVKLAAARGATLYIDAGAGGEEAERVARAVAVVPERQVRLCRGSFAEFAALIRSSDLYIGYDSAGQHAAAACGVPQIAIFAGEACERMFQRWRPAGQGRIVVIRANRYNPAEALHAFSDALARL